MEASELRFTKKELQNMTVEEKNRIRSFIQSGADHILCPHCFNDYHEDDTHYCINKPKHNIDEAIRAMSTREYRMDNLPQLCGKLDKDLIEGLYIRESDRKIQLELNYLLALKQQMPTVPTVDFVNFVHLAQSSGADPIKKQVYLIPYNNSYKDKFGAWQKKCVGTTIFSYHFFISKAESNKNFDGWDQEDGIADYFIPETGKVIKSLFVKTSVFRKDRARPVTYTAWYPEFVKKNYKTGEVNEQWKKPIIMLGKTSLCNALRQAFPDELGGLNSEYDKTDDTIKENDLSSSFSGETVDVNDSPNESIETDMVVDMEGEVKEDVNSEQIKETKTETKKEIAPECCGRNMMTSKYPNKGTGAYDWYCVYCKTSKPKD